MQTLVWCQLIYVAAVTMYIHRYMYNMCIHYIIKRHQLSNGGVPRDGMKKYNWHDWHAKNTIPVKPDLLSLSIPSWIHKCK